VRPGEALVGVGTALALGSLGLALDNARRVRDPASAPPAPAEDVAVLVPARDEEARIGGCVRSLLRAADGSGAGGRVRVLVLDDGSTDGTSEAARRAAPDDDRLTVLTGTPTPAGWLGKAWACEQLATAASRVGATVLVFVDADVALAPHALAACVDQLRGSGLDLVCPYPRQLAGTWSERLLQPLLQWSWMSTVPLGVAERSSRPSLGVANGQLLVVDAAAYTRAGGHGAVRSEVLEDLALLRAVKAAGGHGVVTRGTDVATCRMYDGWPALRRGYTKSLWSAFGSEAGAAGVVAVLLVAYVVPPVAALRGSRTGAVGYLAGVAARVVVGRRTGSRVLPDAAAHPVSVLLLAGLVLDSVVAHRRGTLRWRGRPVEVAS
jgi:hypothetical protein